MDRYDPERSPGLLIADLNRMLRAEFRRRVEHLGLTQAQWQTLAHLARNQGLKQAQLAEILEIQPITLTRLLDRLQEAGWVERRPDPNDRRAIRLYLTDAARPLIDNLWAEAAAMHDMAFTGISAAEREQLIRTLIAVKANLQQPPAEPQAARPDEKQKQMARHA